MLGALSALLGWQRAIGVYRLLESPDEGFSRRARAGGAVVRAGPGDFCCYAPVDVLGHGASGSHDVVVVAACSGAACAAAPSWLRLVHTSPGAGAVLGPVDGEVVVGGLGSS